jgi:hypothetical protein
MLALVGASPLPLGRSLDASLDVRDTRVTGVVISDRLWRRRFNAAPQLIGTRVQLNGRRVTVVGVAPPDFDWPTAAAVWLPRFPR